ncbi:protein FAM221A-like [Pleurodeles waltl]|uniref:protein FAM221A-like n=1 Tax=Pleurodeles waltl TaxID=8319 RepID=UPI003709A468
MRGQGFAIDERKALVRPGLRGELAPQGAERLPNVEALRIQGGAPAEAVQDYLEYRRIVGDDDQGKLFTPQEYEDYKKRVIPVRLRNRLYVSWRSPTGMDCKLVGPETPCFCTHRYKQHKTDFEELPSERPIHLPCRVGHCQCKGYLYVPLNGTSPIRCRCKHFADDHSEANGHRCKKCSTCPGFHSSFTCGCGKPAYVHQTVVETKEERLAQGKPVGQDVPYAAMGGLTGFSSLAEGYMRLDDSGRGAQPLAFLESSGSRMDHPFLKAYAPQISGGSSSSSQAVSHVTSEEEDMAYFEKRYQEQLKKEKTSKGLKPTKGPTQPRPKQP